MQSSLGSLSANVQVGHYHDLATEYARAAGIDVPSETAAANSSNAADYFETVHPDRFLTAIGARDERFDAIVVDEGQDFADIWWVTLEALLRDPVDGILFVFYDDDQRIYRNRGAFPIPGPHFQLTHNCRSTREIQIAANPYAHHQGLLLCQGPQGRAVEEFKLTNGDTVGALRKLIHRLVIEEGVPLEKIVVLSPRSAKTSQLVEGTKIGNLALSWDSGRSGVVACRTIHWFKGLESPIVILAECDRAHPDTRDALLYVAMTRACNHLIVLGELPAPV